MYTIIIAIAIYTMIIIIIIILLVYYVIIHACMELMSIPVHMHVYSYLHTQGARQCVIYYTKLKGLYNIMIMTNFNPRV